MRRLYIYLLIILQIFFIKLIHKHTIINLNLKHNTKRRKVLFCFLKSGSHLLKNWKLFKNDEKCFLFHLKSSIRFQDIWVFGNDFLVK